jgi:hypothetical protein
MSIRDIVHHISTRNVNLTIGGGYTHFVVELDLSTMYEDVDKSIRLQGLRRTLAPKFGLHVCNLSIRLVGLYSLPKIRFINNKPDSELTRYKSDSDV